MNRSNWIPLHSSLTVHPKFLRFAAALDIDKFHALWHLTALWKFAQDNAADGDISGYDAEEIALVVEWHGEADVFVSALRKCKFLDGIGDEMILHDWHDYGGKLESRRQGNAERARRKYSEEKKQEINVQQTSEGCPQNVREERREEKSTEEKTTEETTYDKNGSSASQKSTFIDPINKFPELSEAIFDVLGNQFKTRYQMGSVTATRKMELQKLVGMLAHEERTVEDIQLFKKNWPLYLNNPDATDPLPAQMLDKFDQVVAWEAKKKKTSGVLSDAELDALAAEF